MIRINLYITKNQIEFLRNLATKTGLTLSEHIRRAIDLYLDKYLEIIDEK